MIPLDELFFDSAATTNVSSEVLNAMLPYFNNKWQNPSSVYEPAQIIKQDINNARKIIADSIMAKPDEIYFTSGGSEANCWAIEGFCKANTNPIVITTTIEHHSTMACVEDYPHEFVPVDSEGFIVIEELEKKLKRYTNGIPSNILVSFILGNNEIGTVQKYDEIIPLCKKYGATVHIDAVQYYPYSGLSAAQIPYDMMSVSGHKLHAPKGIGFLYVRIGTKIKPIIYGSQERQLRGGTENVAYIMGLAEAVKQRWNSLNNDNLAKCRDYMIKQLKERFDCKLNGPEETSEDRAWERRLPNNVNVTFPYIYSAEQLIYLLGENGIYCSAGSACNEGNPDPSHVLTAIGLNTEDAGKTVRFSLPSIVTQKMIDNSIEVIDTCFKLLGVDPYVEV